MGGPGRKAETLEQFFDRLEPAGCACIELVTADLAASYGKVLRAGVPQARVVYDRFYVERLTTDAVDEVRRTEQRRLGKTSGKMQEDVLCAAEASGASEAGRSAISPAEPSPGPRLRVEGVPGDDPRAGQARRGQRDKWIGRRGHVWHRSSGSRGRSVSTLRGSSRTWTPG